MVAGSDTPALPGPGSGPDGGPGRIAPAVGLVLGGGGIAGYAFHAGVLAGLQELSGFDPRTAEVVVGTSAGAIVGALLRGGVAAATIRDHLVAASDDPAEQARLRLLAGRSARIVPRLWGGPDSLALSAGELRRGRDLRLTRLVAGLLPRGRLGLDPITEPLDRLHGSTWPGQTLWIPATDLRTGRRVVFGHPVHGPDTADRDTAPDTDREAEPGLDREPEPGLDREAAPAAGFDREAVPVARAVAASAALPGFFAPVRIDGERYVDGGVDSPFNTDLLLGHVSPATGRTLDLVVVAAPLSLDELDRSMPVGSLARSLPRRRLRRELDRLRADGVPVLVLDPDREVATAMGLNPMSHGRVGAIAEAARALTARRIGSAPGPVAEVLHRARLLERPPATPYPGLTDGG